MPSYLPLILLLLYSLRNANTESTVTINFVGDINLGGINWYQNKHGYCNYNESFKYVVKYLRDADLTVGNLEAPFIAQDMEKDEQTSFVPRIKAKEDSASSLKYAGFDIMNLANNHLNDFRDKPVKYNVDVLKKIGIKSFGYTFGTLKENRPQTPLIVTVKGIKIGFLGYCDVFHIHKDLKHIFYTCALRRGNSTAGPAFYSDEIATRDVSSLKKKVDVVVVTMHWGTEEQKIPNESQLRHLLHLKSLGVRLLIGSHPHVLQGHIANKAFFATFSLGNFMFGPSGYRLADFYYDLDPSLKSYKKFIEYVETSKDPTLGSRILRIVINKKGFLSAKYLSLNLGFHGKSSKCFRPKPVTPRWIDVCSDEDKDCYKTKILVEH